MSHFLLKNESVVIAARQTISQIIVQNRCLQEQNNELNRINKSIKFTFQRDGSKLVQMSKDFMAEIIFLNTRTRYCYSILECPLYSMRAYARRMGAKYPTAIKIE